MAVYFNTFVNHYIWLGAQSLTNIPGMWNPPTPQLSTFWHFYTRNGCLGSGRIEVYEKMPTGSLSFSIPAVFARSLFHCSLAFFARPHWPRACWYWPGLIIKEFLVMFFQNFEIEAFYSQHQRNKTYIPTKSRYVDILSHTHNRPLLKIQKNTYNYYTASSTGFLND